MTETPKYTAEYQYTPGLARKAFAVMLLARCKFFLIFSVTGFLYGIWNCETPNGVPVSYFLFGFVFILWSSWIAWFLRVGRVARALPNKTISVSIFDEKLMLESVHVTSSLRWQAVSSIFESMGFLLIYRKDHAQFTPIPIAPLSPESVAFIKEQVRAAQASKNRS